MFLVELLLIFVALYPVVTSMMWVSGGILFRFLEEPDRRTPEPTQWPGVTVLIPAYREAGVIAAKVADDFTYVSTAGGAFLEWMEGKPLPGVEVLRR